MHDTEKQNQFIELRAKGLSFSRISEEIGVSKPTLIDWEKELKNEVCKAKRYELEALLEKCCLSKEMRIKAFGEMLDSISKELKNRDLKNVPTEKLIELSLKIQTTVKEDLDDLKASDLSDEKDYSPLVIKVDNDLEESTKKKSAGDNKKDVTIQIDDSGFNIIEN